MAKATTYYVTRGSVRGECGHHHRTISGALACLSRDQSGCHSQGGYSDRDVYDQDGTLIPTTTDDDGHLIVDEDPGYGEEDSLT